MTGVRPQLGGPAQTLGARKRTRKGTCILTVCVLAGLCAACSRPETKVDNSWNRKAAAAFLDQREGTWMAWPGAARDQGTFCVSCHTAMLYALARPTLRPGPDQATLSINERKLIDNVTTRVRLWRDLAPYYENEPGESRGTEAVLNALILASYDARRGKLSADTRSAFDEMWSLQKSKGAEQGAWPWIQFNNEPWEAYDSPYYGATLAAIAVGLAPEDYRSAPEIQQNLELLRTYLNREYATETLLNRVSLLWASTEIPGILKPEQQESVINEILSKEQADGGWSASSLVGAWKRRDRTPLVMRSDGYATGLITYVLQQVGVSRNDEHVKDGLSWLVRNQTWWGGRWEAYSLNEWHYDLFPIGAHFMNDAATAYAVLALTRADGEPSGATAQQAMPDRSASVQLIQ
jgi:squalene-hopene/tetraprenyl-beta-curcumene cyclase